MTLTKAHKARVRSLFFDGYGWEDIALHIEERGNYPCHTLMPEVKKYMLRLVAGGWFDKRKIAIDLISSF